MHRTQPLPPQPVLALRMGVRQTQPAEAPCVSILAGHSINRPDPTAILVMTTDTTLATTATTTPPRMTAANVAVTIDAENRVATTRPQTLAGPNPRVVEVQPGDAVSLVSANGSILPSVG